MKKISFRITVTNPQQRIDIHKMGKIHNKLIKAMKGDGGSFYLIEEDADHLKSENHSPQTKCGDTLTHQHGFGIDGEEGQVSNQNDESYGGTNHLTNESVEEETTKELQKEYGK